VSWFTDNALGIFSMVGSGIATLCGMVWWMSALYSKVNQIHQRVDEFVGDYKEDRKRLWQAIDGIDNRLDDHDKRIVSIETKLE